VELTAGRQPLAGSPWAKFAEGWSCRRTGKGLGKKRKRKGMTHGSPQVSEVDSRDVVGAFLSIQKYQSLLMGPKASNTYKMTHLKQTSNCNGIFPNRRIVMTYLRNAKVVMAYIK
jgi:hypothetical protein